MTADVTEITQLDGSGQFTVDHDSAEAYCVLNQL
jgi:hypothetical protein